MPPTPRHQLNVRLPPELIEQIDADGRAKQDVVADALRAWFGDSSENGGGSGDDSMMIAALTGQLDEKDRQIAAKDEQLTAALVLLHDAITPPLQLPAAEREAQVEGGRKWWQVWKW